jgi:hypothetical protein
MACGCAERATALKAALIALSQGNGAKAREEMGKVVTSAARDLSALRRQAAARLGLRRG